MGGGWVVGDIITKTYRFEQEYDNGSMSSTDEDDDGNETDEVAPNESERVKQLIKVSIESYLDSMHSPHFAIYQVHYSLHGR